MRYSSLQAWLDWQQTLHPKAIDMSLDRINLVATLAGVDGSFLKAAETTVVTVGGTNGKGSCVRTMEQLLLADRCTVGAFTSPHVLRYNERIRINGTEASDDQILQAFDAIDQARGDISLTYFEFNTLAAAWLFKRHNVHYWLLEVGLGGRLDSVNIWPADIAIITSIGIDHVQWLGDNREDIGREKAGIFRPEQTAFCADLDPPTSIIEVAKEQGTKLSLANHQFGWRCDGSTWHWWMKSAAGRVIERSVPKPRLPQPSVAAALATLASLDKLPAPDQLQERLPSAQLPGRFQRLTLHGRTLVLDVAHNPQSVELLVQNLKAEGWKTKPMAIFAALKDKDIGSILHIMAPIIERWRLPKLPGVARAAAPEDILARLSLMGAEALIDADIKHSLAAAALSENSASTDQLVVVFGSFHTIEACLMALEQQTAIDGSQIGLQTSG